MVLRTRRARHVLVASLSTLMLAATSCASNAPQDTLEPAGDAARTIDNLFTPVFWIAVVVFVLVQGLLVVSIVKFRSRGRDHSGKEPVQTHGNTKMEIGWTIIPALLLFLIAIPTVKTIFDLAEEPKGDVLAVTVTGHLWWWEYEYPDLGVITANELVIPADRPIRLSLKSKAPTVTGAEGGVIHSFWVPRLAGKQDVIPGRVNKLTIEADAPGTYYGQCAEFCGLSHANMRLRVISKSPDDFEDWIREQRRPASTPMTGDAAAGSDLFTSKGCIGCHAIDGVEGAEARVGPDLTHLQSRSTFAGSIFEMNSEELGKWLADPPKRKPGSKMPKLNLSAKEIGDLVAYLETLR